MPSPDARRIAATLVSAVKGSGADADVTDQVEAAARQAAPEFCGDPALAAAGQLYKVIVDPRPTRGWAVLDLDALEEVLFCAFVQDPHDPLWHDYEAHLAAIERARPRLNPLLGLVLRRTPAISPEGLQGIRETRAALLAHRRWTD